MGFGVVGEARLSYIAGKNPPIGSEPMILPAYRNLDGMITVPVSTVPSFQKNTYSWDSILLSQYSCDSLLGCGAINLSETVIFSAYLFSCKSIRQYHDTIEVDILALNVKLA